MIHSIVLEHKGKNVGYKFTLDTDKLTVTELSWTLGADPEQGDREETSFATLEEAQGHFEEMEEVFVEVSGFKRVA